MNLNVDLNEADFVDEIRAFLCEKLPPDRRFVSHELSHMNKEDTIWWQQILAQKGWLVPSWPMEDGGTGWSIPKQFIFRRECQNAGAPRVSPFGPVMVGPVISNFGTEEQKRRFLPGIREGTTLWCQGYSEPGSGSALASKTVLVKKTKVGTMPNSYWGTKDSLWRIRLRQNQNSSGFDPPLISSTATIFTNPTL